MRLIGGEPGRYGYNYFVSMIMERLGLSKGTLYSKQSEDWTLGMA